LSTGVVAKAMGY